MTVSNSVRRETEARWLQGLLRERISPGLVLSPVGAKGWRLRLQESTHSVHISGDASDFLSNPADPDLVSWDPASEGFEAVLPPPLPAPGLAALTGRLWKPDEDGGVLGYDIPAFAAWMLSRTEEIGRTDLDHHGRFPAIASHAFRHGYLERPIVDEWFEVLAQIAGRVWPGLKRVRIESSVKVSHDVDSPSRYAFGGVASLARTMAGDLIRRRDLRSFLQGPLIRSRSRKGLAVEDPSNTFDWIMDQSDQHGLKSAFYFICGRTDAARDAAYEPEDPRIRTLMRHIHARGHEIGLHPSYGTYRDPIILAAEAARLRRVCAQEGISQPEWGGRMHYLRWEVPTTPLGWEAAGMAYDSSLGYADRPGFRCGTCFEYPAFDPVSGHQLMLRIRPLIAMECTVMAERYMGLGNGKDALSKFIDLKQACQAVGGIFTTLWHNTVFADPRTKSLYQSILDA